MGPSFARFVSRAASPHEIKRRGETLHVYRLPAQRLIWNLVGVLISLGPTINVVEKISLSRLQAEPAVTAAFCLFLLIPAAWFTWGLRFGVRVSSAGVKSVSPSRVSFTPWEDIARFVVAETVPTTAVRESCV